MNALPLLALLAHSSPPQELGSPPAPTIAGLSVDEVLVQVRAAADREAWDTLAGDLLLTGRAIHSGAESDFELVFSPDGHFRFATEGPLATSSGWDGETAWARERNGPARTLDHEEREASLLSQWVHSGFWMDPRAGLDLELLRVDEDRVALRIAVPGSTNPSELTIDRRTWRPTEFLRRSSGMEFTAKFSRDRRTLGGVLLPHLVEMQPGPGRVEIRAAERVASSPAERAQRFGSPRASAGDTRFLPELEGPIEIRRAASGHLLVQPSIDGEPRGWFLLDTGAGQNCIDVALADELGLPEHGSVPATGTAGTVTASFRRAETFQLGPLLQDAPVFVGLELAFLEPYLGVPVAGISGYDVFARAVVALDPVAPSAALYDPATYTLERGTWTPMTLDGRLPVVSASFEDGRSGAFKLDTGSTGAVAFHAHAVEALQLLAGRETREVQTGGIGGVATARQGSLAWLELGGRRFESVTAEFATSAVGVQGDTAALGTIGSGLLGEFDLVFDYPHSRLALLPKERGDD